MVVSAHKKKRKKIDPGEQVSNNGSIAKNPRKKSRKSEAQKLKESKAKAAREDRSANKRNRNAEYGTFVKISLLHLNKNLDIHMSTKKNTPRTYNLVK